MRAIVCNVLPRPFSSAKMQPVAFAPDRPITHEYMNCHQSVAGCINVKTHLDARLLMIPHLRSQKWVQDDINDLGAPYASVSEGEQAKQGLTFS